MECIREKADSEGLYSKIKSEDEATTILFEFGYIPTSIEDSPPSIISLDVSGATHNLDITEFTEVPYGGYTLLLERIERSKVTIVLNTSKGSVTEPIPALPPSYIKISGIYTGVYNASSGTDDAVFTDGKEFKFVISQTDDNLEVEVECEESVGESVDISEAIIIALFRGKIGGKEVGRSGEGALESVVIRAKYEGKITGKEAKLVNLDPDYSSYILSLVASGEEPINSLDGDIKYTNSTGVEIKNRFDLETS